VIQTTKMKRTLILLLLLPTITLAQDFKSDLEKMYEAYAGLTDLSVTISIKVFENMESTIPIITQNALINKEGEDYLYSFNEITMLSNKKCMLMINHEQKDIVYRKKDQGDLDNNFYSLVAPDFDSIVNKCDMIRYLGSENGNKHYLIRSDKNIIRNTHLFLNDQSGLISKLIYEYDAEIFPQNSKVEIEFLEMNTKPEFDRNIFSESKYVLASEDVLRSSKDFSDYNLIVSDDQDF